MDIIQTTAKIHVYTIHDAINKQNKYKYIQRTKIIWDVDCHVIPNYRQKTEGGGRDGWEVDNI